MRLFKLPYLCQKEVFNVMTFSTRYTFTFGTRRMKIWAECLQKSLKKSPELQMEFGDAAHGFLGYVSFFVKSGKQTEKIMVLACREVKQKNIRVIKIGDFELQCDVSFSPNILIKYNNQQTPTIRILESLCGFFNTTREDVVYILQQDSNFHHLPPIPLRKSVLRVTNRLCSLNLIEDFYSNYSSPHFSMIQVESGHSDIFHRCSPPRFVQNLLVIGLDHVHWVLWAPFQGENAVFSGRRIETFDMNTFLRMWSRGKSNNLETMIVEVTDPIQDYTIFEGISHTREQKNFHYPYSSIIQDYHDFAEDAFNCSNTYTITRHAGTPREKKATVKITRNSFMFFVWD